MIKKNNVVEFAGREQFSDALTELLQTGARQLIAQAVALTGCRLKAVVRHDFQRQLLEANGIAALSGSQVGHGDWDVVIEATGSPGGFELARHGVRPRGTMVLKSTFKGDVSVNLSALVVEEVTLVGSRCGPFPPALALLSEGKVDPLPLIKARYRIGEALQAFDHAGQPGVLKVLLTM